MYSKVKSMAVLRLLHHVLPVKHKLDFLIKNYLHFSGLLAIKYFKNFYICTNVTDLNRRTISELILEGQASQPELHLIKQLQQQLPNDLSFVDVGGNVGTFMWQFADKCSDVTIFEPVPRLNRVIEDSIAYNGVKKVKLIKKALGDHVDVLTMLDNNNSNIVYDTNEQDTVTVPVSTLDIELKDRQRIDFIKIDVEGFELKVLNGGIETIKKHDPLLLIELHPTFILQYGDKFMDVIELIELLKYDITYYSYTEERRMLAAMRIVNRWSGNPGKVYHSKASILVR